MLANLSSAGSRSLFIMNGRSYPQGFANAPVILCMGIWQPPCDAYIHDILSLSTPFVPGLDHVDAWPSGLWMRLIGGSSLRAVSYALPVYLRNAMVSVPRLPGPVTDSFRRLALDAQMNDLCWMFSPLPCLQIRILQYKQGSSTAHIQDGCKAVT